jgi:hypothetical protein
VAGKFQEIEIFFGLRSKTEQSPAFISNLMKYHGRSSRFRGHIDPL